MKNWLNPGLWFTLLLIALLGIWPILGQNAAAREVIFTVLLSVVFASSLNILLGYTGYVSFGHIVFYGLGGYIGMFLIERYNVSLWIATLAGGAAAALLAFLLGKAILRLRGAYFALATIGINEAMRAFVNNFAPFGGPTGIELKFQVYKAYGGAAQALWLTYYTIFALAILVVLVSFFIKQSKFGLSLMAIREDEDTAEVMGVVTPNAKTWAYVLSAILPGMVGVLFFFKNGNVEPGDAFRLHFSIENLVMVMLGGQGTVLGPVLGAVGYQRLRGFLLTNPVFKNIQLSVAGALLLLIVLFIPAGAVGWLRNRLPRLRKVLP
ncbi:branched-chain amino acid ABC transporter permease [bacterium]|nr:branched-chain amino acid ABC transporter permease [bacterium]OIO89731.1 MAG: branched-chain amino acid ABC transporter permease [Anaerolineae bacterium CG2_30_58_95]PIU90470.1 MAG: branched-chain amino acid ABC transporter permease [Anaerolineae bacterium CG06_land_8_20_14_3_00_57_67]PIW19276.1 MAG: branched-chain amino acid ABC transporter permease [Anaerolineae bacterium CG17_big_fil_post_rev_8_21_14_2_50_57_27]